MMAGRASVRRRALIGCIIVYLYLVRSDYDTVCRELYGRAYKLDNTTYTMCIAHME